MSDTLTASNLRAITSCPTVRRCVQAYLEAATFAKLQHERMEPIHRQAMEFWKPRATRNGRPGDIITDIRKLYQCDDEERCANIYRDVEEATKAAGMKVTRPGNCPGLEAESLVRHATRAVLTAACAHLPPPLDDAEAIYRQLDTPERLRDIVVDMVVQSGGVSHTPTLAGGAA